MRLPDVAPSICEKLGAPIPSPTRPKPQPLQPGATTARSRSDKARKPLGRNFTDDPLGAGPKPRPPPTLARSTTDTALPSLKRSLSNASLASAAPSIASVRPALERARRREVDLAAVARTTAERRARRAEVQAQLDDAIATLKRPNARAAVGELVDAADLRKAAAARARKPQNPTRHPRADAVQVLATPKAPRVRPFAPPEMPAGRAPVAEPVLPPVPQSVVPSSTAKPAPAKPASVLDSLRRPRASQMPMGCEGTPTRRGVGRSVSSMLPAGSRSGDLGEPDELGLSPQLPPPRTLHGMSMAAPRKRPLDVVSGNLMTPTKKRRGPWTAETKGGDECVQGTPIKQTPAPSRVGGPSREMEGVADTPVKRKRLGER